MTRLKFAPISAVLFALGGDLLAILTTNPTVGVMALGFTAVTLAILSGTDHVS